MPARIVPAGDSAWLIELPDRIDVAVNERAIQIAAAVSAEGPPISDVVVGYRTVMVYADPLAERASGLPLRLQEIASVTAEHHGPLGASLTVPVCYDGPYGPDLGDVAEFAGCSVDEVIAIHLSMEYRVFVVGFMPGFAYMAPVDPRLAAPRRASPRLKVPAGSVAVAAGQTGVYPCETPGGWSLIGRCPARPYDPARPAPFLFQAGDHVRFTRISEETYRATSEWGDA